jgi:hypothetical protein
LIEAVGFQQIGFFVEL